MDNYKHGSIPLHLETLTLSDQPIVKGNAKAEKIITLASNAFHCY